MKLEYSHYSPYQFATSEETTEPHKLCVIQKKEMVHTAMKRKRLTHNLGATMPIAEAHAVSSLPTAFISPNSPDAMRQIKSVFKY